MGFKRKKRFRELHRPLNESELAELEKSLLEDGQLEPITVMQGDVIVDGDHREQLLRKHKIEPKVRVKQFASEDDAEQWILRHQLARRNLSPTESKLAMGRLYNSEKKPEGRPKTPKNKGEKLGQNDLVSTAAQIAQETGVSEATVKRAGKFAEAFDLLPKGIKDTIRENPKLATDKAVQKMAKKTVGELSEIGRKVRVGHAKTFDEAVGLKKPAAGKAKTSAATYADQALKHFAGAAGVVQLLDKVAQANGGKGPVYEEADGHANGLIGCLKKMRGGAQ